MLFHRWWFIPCLWFSDSFFFYFLRVCCSTLCNVVWLVSSTECWHIVQNWAALFVIKIYQVTFLEKWCHHLVLHNLTVSILVTLNHPKVSMCVRWPAMDPCPRQRVSSPLICGSLDRLWIHRGADKDTALTKKKPEWIVEKLRYCNFFFIVKVFSLWWYKIVSGALTRRTFD